MHRLISLSQYAPYRFSSIANLLNRVTILIIWLLLCSFTIWAQSNGATTSAIVGTVRDSQQAVIAGTSVKLKEIATNTERTATTDEQGSYQFIHLNPGNYLLTVALEGFVTQQENVKLNLGITALLDVVLQPGLNQEVIEVKAESLLNNVKTESSNNIDESRILTLPINRRDYLQFALTTARVTPDRIPLQGAATTSGLAINGQSARNNTLTIDGLNNNDLGTGNSLSTFSQEGVQEFQIITDGYTAEFGRALSGVVNIVTKRGSNDTHGSLFFFTRNDEISARDAFAPFKPDFRQFQFGATLSGPIKKDRLFYFSSFERLSIKQNNIITISNQTIESIRRSGAQISNGPVPFSEGISSVLVRVDGQLSANNLFWLRYNGNFNYNGNSEFVGGLTSDTNGGIDRVKYNSIAFNNTYIKNNFVNETRFIFSRRNRDIVPIGQGPQVRIVAPEGLISYGSNILLPQLVRERVYQFVNISSLTAKQHFIKFGVDLLYGYSPSTIFSLTNQGFLFFQPVNFTDLTGIPGLPSFTGLEAFDPSLRNATQIGLLKILSISAPTLFPGFPKGVPLDQLPIPATFIQGFGNRENKPSNKLFAGFIQDDLKLRPNLLIKAGLRYDINRLKLSPDTNGNIAPRLGFSYSPSKFKQLRLHGSYGLFFGGTLFGTTLFVEGFQNGYKVLTLPPPFSSLPLLNSGGSFPVAEELPQGVNFIPQLSQISKVDPNRRTSYSQQINFGFDYHLNNSSQISLEYVNVRGIKLVQGRNINPIVRPVGNNPTLSATTGRVDPSQGTIIESESAFDSYYHAGTISFNQRLANNINLVASYTLSKAIDNVNDINATLLETNNSLDIGSERGLSLQDVHNRFVLSGIFSLDNRQHILLRNSSLSTIVTLESGHPYNLLAGVDLNFDGDFPPGDRPLALGRNVGISPGYANVDLRFTRTINIRESVRLEFIGEAFNLFNRVNIRDFDRTFTPDAQGRFHLPAQSDGRYIVPRALERGAFSPREFQLGLRIQF